MKPSLDIKLEGVPFDYTLDIWIIKGISFCGDTRAEFPGFDLDLVLHSRDVERARSYFPKRICWGGKVGKTGRRFIPSFDSGTRVRKGKKYRPI